MSECIEWGGSKNQHGYGRKWRGGKLRLAHRLAFVDHYGLDIDDIAGLHVCHRCDNPPCCNPDHLFLGTALDNVQDMRRKGRGNYPSAELHGRRKLTLAQVREIRTRWDGREFKPITYRELAAEYGVQRRAIGQIVNNHTWVDADGQPV